MPRVYVTSASYPELHDVERPWTRSVTWWRAFHHASRHADFWRFVVVQVLLLLAFVTIDIGVLRFGVDLPSGLVHAFTAGFALTVFGYLQVSWGGDMMRRHLRAVSDVARFACPKCGHSLRGHLEEGGSSVRCPECASVIERTVFEPPYRVPRQYCVFPFWRR